MPDERADEWRSRLAGVRRWFLRPLDGVDALALPTLDRPVPLLGEDMGMVWLTFPVNAARLLGLGATVGR